jgi:hypothetical protein
VDTASASGTEDKGSILLGRKVFCDLIRFFECSMCNKGIVHQMYFKKLPKFNNDRMDKNSSNLVALARRCRAAWRIKVMQINF